MTFESLTSAVRELTLKVEENSARQDAIEALADSDNRQNRRLRRGNLYFSLLAISLVFDVFLSVVVIWNVMRVSGVQERTSSGVLCPLYISLYQQIKTTTDEDLRKLQLTDKQISDYHVQAKAILDGYGVLKCG